MGKLIYSFFVSLDGYIADEKGNFAWAEPDKIVFSRTLTTVATTRTTIEREFDLAYVRDLKERSERDIALGGPTLAAEAIRAGLVTDRNHRLFTHGHDKEVSESRSGCIQQNEEFRVHRHRTERTR